MAINMAVGSTSTIGIVRYSSIYDGILQVKVNSRNIASNTSNITVNWIYKKNASDPYGSFNNYESSKVTLVINGATHTANAPFDLRNAASGSSVVLFSKNVTIAHGAEGDKSINISGYHVTGNDWGTKSITSQEVNLPTIPRASSISACTASVEMNGTNKVTIGITRASTTFTHKVVFSLGNNSKEFSSVTTSSEFAIPVEWCRSLPNSTTGTATVTVTTYNGSTQIGNSVSKSFTVTVPASIVPTFTSLSTAVINEGTHKDWGIYVQKKSKVKLTITGAAGAYGSTIKNYSISGDGYSGTSSSLTTGFINRSGSITYTAIIKDSRGRKTTKTAAISSVAYSPPTILDTTKVERCDSAGKITDEGTSIKITPYASYSSCSAKNTLTLKCQYKVRGATAWSDGGVLTSGTVKTIGNNIIDTNKRYDVKIELIDKFITVGSSYIIDTSESIFDAHRSGRGIAFGKASETAELFEVGYPAIFHEGVKPIAISTSGGSLNSDKYKEGGFWFFYTAAAVTNAPGVVGWLKVLAMSESVVYQTWYDANDRRMWTRGCYGGTTNWSAWKLCVSSEEVKSGTVNITPVNTTGFHSVTVNFGGSFSAVPRVTLTPRIANPTLAIVSTSDVTTTNFKLWYKKTTAAGFPVDWVAIK